MKASFYGKGTSDKVVPEVTTPCKQISMTSRYSLYCVAVSGMFKTYPITGL